MALVLRVEGGSAGCWLPASPGLLRAVLLGAALAGAEGLACPAVGGGGLGSLGSWRSLYLWSRKYLSLNVKTVNTIHKKPF